VQLEVPFLAIEGADHMPGIPLLEWPATDLRHAIIEYFAQRQTFTTIGTEPADLRLVVKAWLTCFGHLTATFTGYILETDLICFRPRLRLRPTHPKVKPFGSSVRWVTASDQDPITDATTQALHQLAIQIEQDREFVIKSTHR
jgi:hypothetical protein